MTFEAGIFSTGRVLFFNLPNMLLQTLQAKAEIQINQSVEIFFSSRSLDGDIQSVREDKNLLHIF